MLQIKMKKWSAYLLVMLCLAMSAAVGVSAPLPAGKDEVVYANLAADGAVEMVYVVNAFTLEQDGTVTDYGDYSSLKNLTNKAAVHQDGDKITAAAGKGRFYYQGTLKTKNLPWLFQLQYFLDGREVAPEELAGADGQVALSLQVRQNPAVDAFFFNNYTLQVTITLDSERCREIEAEGATVATVGKNRIITYTLLPGMEKTFTLEAQVSDFAMDGIQLNAVPLQFDLRGEELSQLTGAFGGLAGGIAELANGTKELHTGAKGIRDALSQVRDGAETLERGSRAAAEGAKEFAAGIKTVADGVKSSENALAEITGGLQELAGENSSLQAGAAAIFDSALAAANKELSAQISLPGITIPALTRDNYSQVLAGLINTLEQYGAGQAELAALSALQEELAGMDAFYQGLVAYTEGVRNLSEGGGRLLAGMAELAQGTATLQAQAEALAGGNEELANGLGELGASLARLEEGAGEMAAGVGKVSDGAGALQAATAKLDEEVGAAIPSALSGGHAGAKSFVSPKNKNVETLQFVFKTAGIRKEAAPSAAAPEAAEQRTFWQRLLDLFQRK
ncbi:MAG: hypothetical protein GX200_01590 [Firmicutes bacterium]|nr:hypothetical protein [Bacillota bacterium]